MVSTIGIKIANGEFYSILKENTPVKKRLVLTTVHDNQQSVHINLYKSDTATMQNALYIGSLFVDHLKPAPKGEPSIEIVVTSNGYGEIMADVVGLDSVSEARHLQVSLKALVDLSPSMDADFEVEDVMPNLGPPPGLYVSETKKKSPWFIALVSLLSLLTILFLLWFFLFRGKDNRETLPDVFSTVESSDTDPAVESESRIAESEPFMPIKEVTEEPKQAEAAVPFIEASVQAPVPPLEEVIRSRPALPPVALYKVPITIPHSGASYQIRWGDTLWDISEAFYRNPWLYPRIARFNNIRNSNLIVSCAIIRVPPR
jgi:molecular chaperone DnaK (HSP70)